MSDRAVSVPINFTFSVIIVSLLLSGLVITTTGELQAQQERTVESDFSVLSNRMAADIVAADQLARATEGTEQAVVRTSLPSSSAGTSYSVHVNATEIEANEAYAVTVRLEARGPDVVEEVGFKTGTRVSNTSMIGGDYAIEYVDDGDPRLEVRND